MVLVPLGTKSNSWGVVGSRSGKVSSFVKKSRYKPLSSLSEVNSHPAKLIFISPLTQQLDQLREEHSLSEERLESDIKEIDMSVVSVDGGGKRKVKRKASNGSVKSPTAKKAKNGKKRKKVTIKSRIKELAKQHIKQCGKKVRNRRSSTKKN